MTVAHIAWEYGLTNVGGAALSAVRLHLTLLEKGIDSHYVCLHYREGKTTDSESVAPPSHVHVLPRGFWRKMYILLARLTWGMWKFTTYRRSLSVNVVPWFGLEAELKKIKPDVVHIHWANGNLYSYEQIAKLPYKFVFNLHDLYVLCGFAVHPGDDQRFVDGYALKNSSRLESWIYKRKCTFIERINPFFIADSVWVESMCRRSWIGRRFRVCTIPDLPNPVFYPPHNVNHPRQADRPLILLFGCWGGLSNTFKGFPDLMKSFEHLSEDECSKIELRVFGSKNLNEEKVGKCRELGIRIVNIGVPPNEELVREYCSVDVFVFPSVKETFGLTKVEASLCGLPVIAFDRTSCAEGIVHGQNGWIAADGDHASFAAGIRYYLNHLNDIDHIGIALQAARLYDVNSVFETVLQVYQAALLGTDLVSDASDGTKLPE